MDQIIEDPDKIFDNIKNQLLQGVKNRHHGFHIPIFSNTNNKKEINSRIVVLRKFDLTKMKIYFHSDIRSKKTEELKLNPNSNFLFYDNTINTQLRIQTITKIHSKDDVTYQAWENTKLSSRKCYLVQQSPSSISPIATDSLPKHLKGTNPTQEESEKGYVNFAVVSNQIKTIEWLYLSSKGHRRLLFEINKNQYNFHWLIP